MVKRRCQMLTSNVWPVPFFGVGFFTVKPRILQFHTTLQIKEENSNELNESHSIVNRSLSILQPLIKIGATIASQNAEEIKY